MRLGATKTALTVARSEIAAAASANVCPNESEVSCFGTFAALCGSRTLEEQCVSGLEHRPFSVRRAVLPNFTVREAVLFQELGEELEAPA